MGKNVYLFSKKGKRKFNKLSDADKKVVAELAVKEAVNPAMRKAISDAMITGMRLKAEALYQKYVQNMDKLEHQSDDWLSYVDKLVSAIRLDHIEYEKMQNGERSDEEGSST